MASPVDANRLGTNGTTAVDPQPVNMPSGVVSGDLLIVLFRCNNVTTVTTPTGWTDLHHAVAQAPSDDTMVIAYRLSDGTEGASEDFDPNVASKYAAIVWRITGAANPAVQAPELSTLAEGATDTVDPTTVTPTGGSKDYLFLWLGGWEGEQISPPATGPTNYSNWTGASSGTGGAVATNCRVAGGSRQLTASSEDPGSVTISAADDWRAWAMAIHPPAAAPSLIWQPARPTHYSL